MAAASCCPVVFDDAVTQVGNGSQLPTSAPVIPRSTHFFPIAVSPLGPDLEGVSRQSACNEPNWVAALSTPFWHLTAVFKISSMFFAAALAIVAWHFALGLSAFVLWISGVPSSMLPLAWTTSTASGENAPRGSFDG